MNKKTADTLKKCGVPPHLLGYEYLGEAIELVLEDRKLRHKTVKIYHHIAQKFNSTYARVERAMRHAIEVAFNNLSTKTAEELFGNTSHFTKSCPTNSHFIAAVAEYIEYSNEG